MSRFCLPTTPFVGHCCFHGLVWVQCLLKFIMDVLKMRLTSGYVIKNILKCSLLWARCGCEQLVSVIKSKSENSYKYERDKSDSSGRFRQIKSS